jgi:serine/threonine protein phosphatase PrpC
VHGTQATQMTKDHIRHTDGTPRKFLRRTHPVERPDHGVLTRSLGRELIAAVDRISFPIGGTDTLLLCTDGLYNALSDSELAKECRLNDAPLIARSLIETANTQGTHDNLTVGVCRVRGPMPAVDEAQNWVERLRHWIRS